MLADEIKRAAMKTIVDALRAMGPLTVNELYGELLVQCRGVHAGNVDNARQSALIELRQRNVIERYGDSGSAWDIHPRMYDKSGQWDETIDYV